MHAKSPKWLDDIAVASSFIVEEADGRTLTEYEHDRLLKSAIERNFEIIGEALLRLERADPETAQQISDYRKIIGFRNRLIHGYDEIDNRQVWEIIQQSLPILRNEVRALLSEAERESTRQDDP